MSNNKVHRLKEDIVSDFMSQVENTKTGEDSETLVIEFNHSVDKDDIVSHLSNLRDNKYNNLGFVVEKEKNRLSAGIKMEADSPQELGQHIAHKLGIDDSNLVEKLSMVSAGVKSEREFESEDIYIVLGVFAQSEDIPTSKLIKEFNINSVEERNFERKIEKVKNLASPEEQEKGNNDDNQSAFDW